MPTHFLAVISTWLKHTVQRDWGQKKQKETESSRSLHGSKRITEEKRGNRFTVIGKPGDVGGKPVVALRKPPRRPSFTTLSKMEREKAPTREYSQLPEGVGDLKAER